MDPRSDEQLVMQLRGGSSDAFEQLYERYRRHIYTFCLKLSGDRSLAEDATHDTFVRMHDHIGSLNDAAQLRTWLFSIARNGVFRQLHNYRRNGSYDDENVWTDETPLSIAEHQNASAIVSACIALLKPEYREVLFLREYEQHTYVEIALITGNTEDSVKSRLFKARKALAEKLKPYFKD